MPNYTFFYNRAGGYFNKLIKPFKVPISGLTKYAQIEADDDHHFLVRIGGISGPAWTGIGVVLTDQMIPRAPYFGDVIQKEDGTFWVIDTNWVLESCEIDTEHINDTSVVDGESLFSRTPSGLIPPPAEMNEAAAREQVKRAKTSAAKNGGNGETDPGTDIKTTKSVNDTKVK